MKMICNRCGKKLGDDINLDNFSNMYCKRCFVLVDGDKYKVFI